MFVNSNHRPNLPVQLYVKVVFISCIFRANNLSYNGWLEKIVFNVILEHRPMNLIIILAATVISLHGLHNYGSRVVQ